MSAQQFGLACALTMFVWNHPERRAPYDRGALLSIMNGATDRDLDVVLECAFWICGEFVYSHWVQRWLGIPTKRTPIPRHMRSIVRQREISPKGRLICEYCGVDCTFDHQFDHRLPLSRGGLHHPDNLCIACPTCNQRKGGMTAEEFWEAIG